MNVNVENDKSTVENVQLSMDKNTVENVDQSMEDESNISQSILKDNVIPQCEDRPPLTSPSSIPVSRSSSVHKPVLADPSSKGSVRNKKLAKEPGRKARKSPSAKASVSNSSSSGTAVHAGLPKAVSAVPPRNRPS